MLNFFKSTALTDDTAIIRRINRGYVLALTVIVILTLLCHQLTSEVIKQEIMGAEVSSNISGQITYITQVGKYANSLYSNQSEFDKTLLENSIFNLKISSDFISNYINSTDHNNTAKDSLKTAMKSSLKLENHVKEFIVAAEYFLQLNKNLSSPASDEAKKESLGIQKSLKSISLETNQELIKLLQISLADHQEKQIGDIKDLHKLQTFLTYGIVFIIFLEALFIFRPLVKTIEISQKNLIKMALEDVLTGLKNRRAFGKDFDAYQNSMARRKENKENFVIAVCDLDKFKSVNDTYGHDVGDLVLKHFANILRNTMRPSDVISRMGGEEFVILLTNTNEEKAYMVLERLRQKVESNPCPLKGNKGSVKLKFTTSIGYVEGPLEVANSKLEYYFKQADKALYKAKEGGRNMVVNGKDL